MDIGLSPDEPENWTRPVVRVASKASPPFVAAANTPLLHKAYNCSSCLNRKHMTWAWFSLFWVGFSDVYVRLCAAGIWHDWRIV